ncbi:hypothetical protein NE693_17870, partial [Faecalibacterium prausnitzii]|nr:hypothetical protein [Faecalibacterium prausnitzii]
LPPGQKLSKRFFSFVFFHKFVHKIVIQYLVSGQGLYSGVAGQNNSGLFFNQMYDISFPAEFRSSR